jgi:hypothetical protein
MVYGYVQGTAVCSIVFFVSLHDFDRFSAPEQTG